MEPDTHLEITTIAGCKIACSYCPQGLFAIEHKRVSNERLMSLEVFQQSLANVPASVDIHFSGYSEPFLNPDCLKMVQHAFNKGHRVAMYSTLVGMTVADVKGLEKIQFKKFHVHLPDDGAHMRAKIDEGYLEVLRALIESSIPDIVWLDYFGIHPKIAEVLGAAEYANRKLTSRAGNVEQEYLPPPKPHEGKIWCRANRMKKNVLLPNGDVALCCVDFGRKHVLGNLTEDQFDDLHKGAAFKHIVDMMNGAPGDLLCRTCEWAEPVKNQSLLKRLLRGI